MVPGVLDQRRLVLGRFGRFSCDLDRRRRSELVEGCVKAERSGGGAEAKPERSRSVAEPSHSPEAAEILGAEVQIAREPSPNRPRNSRSAVQNARNLMFSEILDSGTFLTTVLEHFPVPSILTKFKVLGLSDSVSSGESFRLCASSNGSLRHL